MRDLILVMMKKTMNLEMTSLEKMMETTSLERKMILKMTNFDPLDCEFYFYLI